MLHLKKKQTLNQQMLIRLFGINQKEIPILCSFLLGPKAPLAPRCIRRFGGLTSGDLCVVVGSDLTGSGRAKARSLPGFKHHEILQTERNIRKIQFQNLSQEQRLCNVKYIIIYIYICDIIDHTLDRVKLCR